MNQDELDIELLRLKERRQFFNNYFPKIEGMQGHSWVQKFNLPNTCPVCGYYTLKERDSWEVCEICNWEDDGQDDHNAETVKGGPNGKHSLTTYRQAFYQLMNNSKTHRFKSITNKIHKYISSNNELSMNDIQNHIQYLINASKKENIRIE